MDKQYKMVPVEPTDEMLTAAYLSTGNKYYWTRSYFIEGYKAALAAAPDQPSPAESDKEAVRNAALEDERAEFEQYFLALGFTFKRYPNGEYQSGYGAEIWSGWQARASMKSQPSPDEPLDSEAIRNALENLLIALSMGWDLDGVIKQAEDSMKSQPAQPTPPQLKVWYGSMPESNGKTNWTAMLYRADGSFMDGITIDRSEYPDRVRYEADRMRFLIGEIPDEPDILVYDSDKCDSPELPAQPVENESEIILNWLIRQMTANELQRIGIPCPPGCTIDDIKQSMKQWKPGDKPKEDQPSEGDVFRALIQYLLGPCRNEEPMGFLHCWNEGDYKGCREWDDIPDILFPKSIRADREGS